MEAEDLLARAIRHARDWNALIVAAAVNDGCACMHVLAAVGCLGHFSLFGGPIMSLNRFNNLTEDFAMKHLQLVITLAWLAGPAAFAHAQKPDVAVKKPDVAVKNADAIYFGGAIVTMDDTNPGAEAIAVKDGKIVAVGKKDAVLNYKGPDTKGIDLGGKTMLPGFIDGHSHFINSLLVSTQANCYSPPAGPADSIPAIIKALKDLQTQQKIEEGDDKFIMAYGYDMNGLAEQRELTAEDLDKDFPKNPVIVGHVSLHGGVLNTKALNWFGITAATKTPPGGYIARKPNTGEPGEPAGLLMETAYLELVLSSPEMPHEDDDVMLKRFKAGQEIYAAAGITTAQEGATHEHDVGLLQKAAEGNLLFIDVVAYPFILDAIKILEKDSKIFETYQDYRNRLKLGGIKITTDGSPQGKTAFFTTPYLTGGLTGEKDWYGEPTFSKADTERYVEFVYNRKLQLLIHCNGDAAIDLFLEAHALKAKDPEADLRTTVIHSQFVRKDQLVKYVQYKIIPSFYTEHCFYFGNTHRENRGREQADFLSPMKTAIGMGLRCANHTDFNVAPIDQLFVVWSAVNRLSRECDVIGPEECITPRQALKAITLDAAYMYREEGSKGSLEVGKLADLVILSRNPLTVNPRAIKDIRVIETIKEGKTVYPPPPPTPTPMKSSPSRLFPIE